MAIEAADATAVDGAHGAEALHPAASEEGPRWPVETADLFVVEPSAPIAVSTLGDPDLARAVAALAPKGLAVAGPTATENIGVEKLVRNVTTDPSLRVLLIAGPETGGSARTGHYAGDALMALHRHGVDPTTMRINGAVGRRPFVKNLSPAEVDLFRRQVDLVDRRGLTDAVAVAEAIHAIMAAMGAPTVVGSRGESGVLEPVFVPSGYLSASRAAYRPDPAGFVLVFADHAGGRLLAEHYTPDGRRTIAVAGDDPLAIVQTLVRRGAVGTLDHAAYLGRELQRASEALSKHEPYLQDGKDVPLAKDRTKGHR